MAGGNGKGRRILRKLVWLLVLLLLCGAGFGWWRYRQTHKPPPYKFETTVADRGRIEAKVTATGTVSALVTVQIGAQVSGRIQELKVDFNSEVHKGEVLARIDPQLFDAAVAQAKANLMAAKGDLTKAKAQAADANVQARRAQQLAEKNFIAQADYDTARANAKVADAAIDSARGRLAQAEATLHQAEVNLQYTTISSPIDGTVISRSVDVGQTVAASLQAPQLFLIAEDLRRMQVDTSVAEADIGKLTPGMEATFTVDAWPGDTFHGTVRQIRNAPQTVQNVVTYDAVLDVSNPKLKLKPGMTANVTYVYAKRDDVLRVSNAALRFRPPTDMATVLPGTATATDVADKADKPKHGGGGGGGGNGGGGGGWRNRKAGGEALQKRTVWLLQAGKPVPVQIRIGISDGTATEVTEGALKVGDVAITDMSETEPKAPNPSGAMGGAPGAGPPRGGRGPF